MTKDEALKLALEALEEINKLSIGKNAICLPAEIDTAMDAIKEALAQPEHGWTPERIAGIARLKDAQDKKLAQPEQEPVAWISTGPARMIHWTSDKPAYGDDWIPLYATPLPCPTCEALARTVMMNQTGRDA